MPPRRQPPEDLVEVRFRAPGLGILAILPIDDNDA
jgi:hypothetical protein